MEIVNRQCHAAGKKNLDGLRRGLALNLGAPGPAPGTIPGHAGYYTSKVFFQARECFADFAS